MNAHRRHYLDLNPPPNYRLRHPPSPTPIERGARWSDEQKPDTGNLIMLAFACFFVGLFAFSALAAYYLQRGDLAARAVPARVAADFELPQLSADEARIEGFRAGMATAAAQGCPAATLSLPIEPR